MDLQIVMPWFLAANTILSLGTVIYTMLTSGSKKSQAEFEKFRDETEQKFDETEKQTRLLGDAVLGRISLQDAKVTAIEETMKHLPDREQSHRLELAIEKMTGRMETMDQRMTGRIETLDERLKPVSAISDRLQEFLLEQAKR